MTIRQHSIRNFFKEAVINVVKFQNYGPEPIKLEYILSRNDERETSPGMLLADELYIDKGNKFGIAEGNVLVFEFEEKTNDSNIRTFTTIKYAVYSYDCLTLIARKGDIVTTNQPRPVDY